MDGDKIKKQDNGTAKKPTVFISYSHKDKDWKELLAPHLKALALADHLILWDDSKINVGADWYPEIEDALRSADAAVCLITSNFLASDFIIKEEIPYFLKKRQDEGMLLVPMLISPCPWKSIPWLKSIQMYTQEGLSIAEIPDVVGQARAFAEIANYICDNIQSLCPPLKIANPIIHQFALSDVESTLSVVPDVLVDVDRLPITGSELFGRQKELELLDKSWDSGTFNVVSFVAWGGVGKSTLVNKWLESMKADNYRGAKRVFGWSFYSQGTSEKTTSADMFIAEALRWFGDPNPQDGSPWDKGQRLAELVRSGKTLLILDGLEPLQAEHDIEKGKIKDPALSVLVQELCKENLGLLVITTREEVPEFSRFRETTVQQNLEQISPESGRALLRTAGVRGTDRELEDASSAFGNNALALRLLGSYLYGEEGHNVTHISKIPSLEHIPVESGRHPRRVMAAFEERFGNGAEVNFLRILGLFDCPTEQESIEAILGKKTISNLTKNIRKLGRAGQKDLLFKLRGLNLIAQEGRHDKDKIDAHPLVRDHFGEQLKSAYPETWKEGHNRLYEYFKKKAPKLPNTIEEMTPLFSAVVHGCAAGKYQETLDEVYSRRIRRGNEAFSVRKLGAFGSDLASLSHFFKIPWHTPAAGLTEENRAAVLNWAGYRLLALGWLTEAADPMQVSMEMAVEQEKWKNAASAADSLCQLYLILGRVEKAVEFAKQSDGYADKSGDAQCKISSRSSLAHTLHQAGHFDEAEQLFKEAEEMQKSAKCQYLYSGRGFHYCDFLLEKGEYEVVLVRAMKTLECFRSSYPLLEFALDNLSLGRGHLLKTLYDDSKNYSETEKYLGEAVDGLRKSGSQVDLPLGLLARAVLYRITKDFQRAHHDLDATMTIATHSGMKLFEADCHTEYARLYHAEDDKEKARDHFIKAKAMIYEMGYHRRDKDVMELEMLLK